MSTTHCVTHCDGHADSDGNSDSDANADRDRNTDRDATHADSHGDFDTHAYADRDAAVMKQYLVETLGYDPDNILYVADATLSDFNQLFGSRRQPRGKLHDYVRPGKSDVFVYYVGHGAPDPASAAIHAARRVATRRGAHGRRTASGRHSAPVHRRGPGLG